VNTSGAVGTLIGLGLIFANLLIDGFTCAKQDEMTRQSLKPVSAIQSLLFMNIWIVIFLSTVLVVDYSLGQSVYRVLFPDAAAVYEPMAVRCVCCRVS
jgi:hypothetical protein